MTTSLASPLSAGSSRAALWSEDRFLFRRAKTWWVLLALFLMASGNGFLVVQERFNFGLDVLKNHAHPPPILWVISAMMALICLVLIAGSMRKTIRQMLRQKPVLAFAVLALVSTLWSQVPYQTFRTTCFLILSMLFAWFFTTLYSPPDQLRMILALGVLVSVASIIWVIMLPQYGVAYSGEWKGIFAQKNILGASMVFLFAGLLFRSPFSRRRLLILLVQSIVPLVLLYMSKSRTSWILAVFFIAVRVLGPFVFRVKKEAIPVFLFATLIGLSVGVASLGFILSLLGRDFTLTGRTHSWSVIFPFALSHFWLGYGYQGFWGRAIPVIPVESFISCIR